MMCRTAWDRLMERITATTPPIRMPTRIRTMGMGMGMATPIIGGRESAPIGAADGAADGADGAGVADGGGRMKMKAVLWASVIASLLCVAVAAQGPPPAPQQGYPPPQGYPAQPAPR